MIKKSRVHDIKKEQKKSFYLRELSQHLYKLSEDESLLRHIFLTRVDLSADGGICYLFFSAIPLQATDSAEKIFEDALPRLKLYKPSLRTALAKALSKKYVPDLLFLFDEKKEKVDSMNRLLDRVQEELAEQEDQENIE